VALAPIAALYEYVEPATGESTRKLENVFTFFSEICSRKRCSVPGVRGVKFSPKGALAKVSLPERIVGHSETI
jgi:hypothetical protein